MKRTILISMLTAAAMFAQSTPATAPVAPGKTTSTAPVSKKAPKKSTKPATAKPAHSSKVVNKKAPVNKTASTPVKQ
jgi:hypothetical protein